MVLPGGRKKRSSSRWRQPADLHILGFQFGSGLSELQHWFSSPVYLRAPAYLNPAAELSAAAGPAHQRRPIRTSANRIGI